MTNIPRKSSQADAYLTMYQNVMKKDRLQKELKAVKKRYNEIQENLALLDQEIKKERYNEIQENPALLGGQINKNEANKFINQKIIPPQSKFKTITLGY